jgi:hypothetical protein
MKLAQTGLPSKSIIVGIIATMMVVALSGCGNPERQKARQDFKGKIAALKVCTQGATYSEFRQAEKDLRTSFETNKKYLDDLNDDFADLDKLMTATDLFFFGSVQHLPFLDSRRWIHPNDDAWQYAVFLSPELEKKANYTNKQIEPSYIPNHGEYQAAYTDGDSDFLPKTLARAGLTKISEQTEVLLNSLDKRK